MECGSGAVVSEGCNTHTRAETAEAVRSRRASRASRGIGWLCLKAIPIAGVQSKAH